MNELTKYLGVIITILGVAVISIPQFMGASTNGTLVGGFLLVAAGIVAHIVVNKKA